MYSSLVSLQILISLLKKHGITTVVISAGQSNSSFARSIEHDRSFECFSVVDERSAAFFAIGLYLEKHKPIAISCTASTACCNYLSAITEAYYRGIPILILTSNYDVRRVDQMRLLSIHQENIFRDVVKHEVQLPDVIDRKSFNYCQRLINETVLELDHHGTGPVHIDIPSYERNLVENCEVLPTTRCVKRYNITDSWRSFAERIAKEDVLLICGQDFYSDELIKNIEVFSNSYGCVVSGEHMSNIRIQGYWNINSTVSNTSKAVFKKMYKPDIIITIGKHVQFDWLYFDGMGIDHWQVNDNGCLCDNFNSLTTIFEADKNSFISKMNEYNEEIRALVNNSYSERITEKLNEAKVPECELSHVYTIKRLCESIPDESILHLSIFNSIRIAQYFKLSPKVKCYANLGALGIDGSMSTFLGQSVKYDGKAFLIIGDLSFFYDMNSLMIRHIRNNVRILLLNNGGGAEFYQNNGWYDTIDLHTAAKHNHKAGGWAKENGFMYLCAHTKDDFEACLNIFVIDSDKPILLEVFNDLNTDMKSLIELKDANSDTILADKMKTHAKKILGNKGVNVVKNILGKQ